VVCVLTVRYNDVTVRHIVAGSKAATWDGSAHLPDAERCFCPDEKDAREVPQKEVLRIRVMNLVVVCLTPGTTLPADRPGD
jgi:hypothetical protein